jgi:dTDP-4-amino-4,6-dideoxygalactose transaminase
MKMETRIVPFLPLGGLVEQDDLDACLRVLHAATLPGGSFFPLPEEKQFEEAFALHEGAGKAVAVNSCGTALDLCMMALNIGPGDEVVVPPLTFVCTATCAVARGAKVVFADIDPNTLCLDPKAVEAKVTSRTKAIIPVHFAGLACDIESFATISQRRGVPVIYDTAHAVGARYNGQPIGGAGKASCYSFQSNKNMTTLGEGGAVTTNDEALAEVVRQKKTFGYVYGPQLRVVTIGFNYRMSKPQLAVGLTQLAKAERIITLRLERFLRMQELLADIEELILPAGVGVGHACHLYVLRLNTEKVSFSRAALCAELKDHFVVQTGQHYPALWSWEAIQSIDYDRSDCPIAEKACGQVLSLPIFPRTSFEDLKYIKEALVAAIHNLRR